jgi:hypothetical protein
MSVETILTIFGGIALLVGIFGGGVKAKEIEVPLINTRVRIISAITGIVLITVAVLLSIPGFVQPAPISATPILSPVPLSQVTITIINNNCIAQDYYVDGTRVLSAIPSGAIQTFQVFPGQHAAYACEPRTNNCASPEQIDWTTRRTNAIGRSSSCPVTITLTNNNCKAQDYYVDGTKVLSAIAPGANETFQVSPRQHAVYSCEPGTNNCASPEQIDWTTRRTNTIGRASYCP